MSDAEPWFKMKDDEKKAIEAENQRKAEEAKKLKKLKRLKNNAKRRRGEERI